jgi:hypothetical protein
MASTHSDKEKNNSKSTSNSYTSNKETDSVNSNHKQLANQILMVMKYDKETYCVMFVLAFLTSAAAAATSMELLKKG